MRPPRFAALVVFHLQEYPVVALAKRATLKEKAGKRECQPLRVGTIETPIGVLIVATDSGGEIWAADFVDHEERLTRLLKRRFSEPAYSLSTGPIPEEISAAIGAYFAGDFEPIRHLRLRTGGTTFQKTVWQGLRDIPAGRPISYATLAAQLGKSNAARAVGHANGSNPFNIIVPCHRLVGANGALTGYAGGIERKRWLLDHEARHAGRLPLT